MPKPTAIHVSRRERQILDILYRRGRASAAQVRRDLPDPPSYSAVRALLKVLETKGHARHKAEGGRYVYEPTRPRPQAGRSALRRVLRTFFDGSPGKAAAALLEISDARLSADEADRITRLIEQARKEGR
jgi:predicted transcriptional regulator